MMTIDQICQQTTNPSLLNALHACRDGHPLNKITPAPFFNAYMLAAQQPYAKRPDSLAIDWLLAQSQMRGEVIP